jgi:mercuric ion binding protein
VTEQIQLLAACPITVCKAMEGVDGVKSVSVDFEAKMATVIFDAAVTSAEKIGSASTNADYPTAPVS